MKKNSVRKSPAVYMILAGLAILAIRIDIGTGIDYGFVIGENEGISVFAITQVVMTYVGRILRIDVFFDPVGYGLIIAGMLMLGRNYQVKKAVLMSAVGIIANITQIIIPLFVSLKNLIIPVIALFLIQILCVMTIMYSFAALCTAEIDNYTYMQVGKDLKFGAELYAICMIVANILRHLSNIGWYFASLLYWVVTVIALLTMGYYIIKALKYVRGLHIFENGRRNVENE